jgi:peptidoglycan/xylan/chitin deacetylase (PgdA/CDA1 family)
MLRRQLLSACTQTLLRILAFGLFYSGALRWINAVTNRFKLHTKDDKWSFPFLKRARSGAVQILVYHRVNDTRDPFFPGTPVKAFTEQMEYLAKSYTLLSMEDAVGSIMTGDIPDNAVVITFDDGYRDNYLQAFPIMKQLGVPAAIFLATDAIGSGKVLWHDRVFSAFRHTRAPLFFGFGGDDSRSYPLATIEEKLFAQGQVLKLLKSVDERERLLLIDRLVEQLEVDDRKEDSELMLTWDEVREMSKHRISFGSHTSTHPILASLSLARAEMEIRESKKILEGHLGKPVTTFAYPNGTKADFSETTKTILRDAGYRCGLTTMFGTNGADQDLFELKRATPWDEEITNFGLRLSYYKFCS